MADAPLAGAASRRRFLAWMAGAGAALASGPLLAACGLGPAPTTQPRVYRIGYLAETPLSPALVEGLRDLGYVSGQNLVIEARASDSVDEQTDLARELMRLNLDCIVVSDNGSTRSAQDVTRGTGVPLVGVNFGDPVEGGFVASLARPGGNLTGVAINTPDISSKRLQILKEAFPRLATVAALTGGGTTEAAVAAAGDALGLKVVLLRTASPADLDRALEVVAAGGADALYVGRSAPSTSNRAKLVEFAARQGLPAIYTAAAFVEEGGLMSFGPDIAAMHRRAAVFVDKVLRGANPGELPVEYATSYELVLNLKTAQALGLTIPQSVLIQATEVIR